MSRVRVGCVCVCVSGRAPTERVGASRRRGPGKRKLSKLLDGTPRRSGGGGVMERRAVVEKKRQKTFFFLRKTFGASLT